MFKFKRRLGYYLFHTYVPTCLIVIMSWISFWIKPEAVPARVTLGVTSLLTLSTQHANSQKSLPPVSYIKAIGKENKSTYGTIHLRRRQFLGGGGSKICQICRWIVVKICQREGGRGQKSWNFADVLNGCSPLTFPIFGKGYDHDIMPDSQFTPIWIRYQLKGKKIFEENM